MEQLDRDIQKVNKSAPRAANNIRQIGRSSRQASQGVGSLTKALRGALAAIGLIQAAKFVVVSTAELESQTKSLEVLTGSLQTAKDVIKELQDFGAVTPFTSSELIETAKRLKAFGVDTEKLVDTTKRLGDVAGATGADLGGVATAFGQIVAKGRLQGEELLQLQERGINLQDELQEMYGITGEEFRKALEKGQISAEAVEQALLNVTEVGGKYANGAIAQSTTLSGKFSTLVDNITRVAQTIGKVLLPALKTVLDQLNIIIGRANTALSLLTDVALGTATQGLGAAGVQLTFGFESDALDSLQQGLESLNPELARNEADLKRFTNVVERFNKQLQRIGPNSPNAGRAIELQGIISSLRTAIGERKKVLDELAKTPETKIPEFKLPEGSLTGDKKKDEQLKSQLALAKDILDVGRSNFEVTEETIDATARLDKNLERQNQLLTATNDLERERLRITFKTNDLIDQIKQTALSFNQEELIQRAQINAGLETTQLLADNIAKTFQEGIRIDEELTNEISEIDKLWAGVGETIQSTIVNSIQGAIDGTLKLKDILADVLSQIGSLLINAGFSTLKQQPGFLGKLFGGGRSGGGPVQGGSAYVVGESGSELFIPNSSGRVIPADDFDAARAAMSGGLSSSAGAADDTTLFGAGDNMYSSSTANSAFADNRSSINNTRSVYQSSAEQNSYQEAVSAVMGSSGSMVIETQVINGVEYATVGELQAATAAATKAARAEVFAEMKSNPGLRRKVGLK